jgi:hypothetical protein
MGLIGGVQEGARRRHRSSLMAATAVDFGRNELPLRGSASVETNS